jgi:hypothetical protein
MISGEISIPLTTVNGRALCTQRNTGSVKRLKIMINVLGGTLPSQDITDRTIITII